MRLFAMTLGRNRPDSTEFGESQALRTVGFLLASQDIGSKRGLIFYGVTSRLSIFWL